MAKNEVSTCVQELAELLSGAKDPVRNVFTAMAVANLASACARAVFREEVGRLDVVEVSQDTDICDFLAHISTLTPTEGGTDDGE